MPELGERLRAYVERAAPITMDEVVAATSLVVDDVDLRRRRRWGVPAVAVAAVLAAVIGVLAVRDGADGGARLEAGRAPSTTETATWLTPMGPEVPAPAVPEGWQVLDAGPVRFAVPPGWAVIRPGPACAGPHPGALVVVPHLPQGFDCPSSVDPAGTIVLTPAATVADGGERAMVGTMPATTVAPRCDGCATAYRLDVGIEVTATGPDAGAVLATFTDSGAVRVLQDGPPADPATWRTIEYGGVALEVPAGWATTDLDRSGTTTAGSGVTELVVSEENPGGCNGPRFPADDVPKVVAGSGPMPSCPAPGPNQPLDLRAGEGVWIRTSGTVGIAGLPSTVAGSIDGLDVVAAPSDFDARSPSLELGAALPDGEAVLVSIGVGLDPSVARAIVRSIRPA
jgi:hypothetical protein